MMNQGRNNQERDDVYQNASHVSRFQNRPGNNAIQIHPNLNPNYQNPIDVIRNYNRRIVPPHQQHQEPEENIYERLDNDDGEDDDVSPDLPRNEPLAQNNQNNANHMYERIDERISCSNRTHCRYYKYSLNHVPAPSFLNDMEGANRNVGQYDQPRHIYIDYSRLSGNFQSSLSRLGRNCFSTENIAYASSTRRSVHPFVYNCTCPYCRHADARYICHHCHNLHNRLRFQDASSSRHYVYQIARNCRCPFCRGEYIYTKLPATALRAAEMFKMESCHCRNPAGCICRNKPPSGDSNSATYVGRYLDWINRTGQSVNNPLYAMVHVSRLDRASVSGNHGNVDPGPSTSGNATSNASRSNDSNPSSSLLRSIFAPGASTSNAPICPVSRHVERQHTCDDSCIPKQSHGGNLAAMCQLLGRYEKTTECNHGKREIYWWFVNKWLPQWYSHNLDRNVDGASCADEGSREQRESDSDDS